MQKHENKRPSLRVIVIVQIYYSSLPVFAFKNCYEQTVSCICSAFYTCDRKIKNILLVVYVLWIEHLVPSSAKSHYEWKIYQKILIQIMTSGVWHWPWFLLPVTHNLMCRLNFFPVTLYCKPKSVIDYKCALMFSFTYSCIISIRWPWIERVFLLIVSLLCLSEKEKCSMN